MKLKKLNLNSVINYSKDIKRYSYDIEDALREFFALESHTLNVLPFAPVPDNVEPEMPRLVYRVETENSIISIQISQLRILFFIDYNTAITINLNATIRNFINMSNSIKELVLNNTRNINILYEAVTLVAENVENNVDNVTIFDTENNLDEKREKIVITEGDYFISTEKIFMKAYGLTNVYPPLNKNRQENFIGYIETYVREINNRELYNNSDNNISANILNIDDIETKLTQDIF